MLMNHRRRVGCVVLWTFALLAFEGPARAQGWLQNRKYSEGIGYRVGDLELHPGIGAEAGFDSNWFQRSPKTGFVNSAPLAPLAPAGILRVTPGLSLSTVGRERQEGMAYVEPAKLAFRASLSGTYRAFLGGSEVAAQNGINGLSGDLHAQLDILPAQPISVGVSGLYSRTLSPNSAGAARFAFNRNDIGGEIDTKLTSPGSILVGKLGYGIRTSLLDDPSVAPYNNVNHTVYARGDWHLSPKSGVFLESAATFLTFTESARAFNELHDATPFRTKLGATRVVSSRLSLLGAAGWGASLVDAGTNPNVEQYSSVIGQLEAKLYLTAVPGADSVGSLGLSVSSLTVGFLRDFDASFLSTFTGLNRGYARFEYFFAGRALMSFEGGVAAVDYPWIFYNNGAPAVSPFTNARADASVFGEYRFTNTFALNTTLRFTSEVSNQAIPVPGENGEYDLTSLRFESYLGARWFL